jgi:hypothetical protein
MNAKESLRSFSDRAADAPLPPLYHGISSRCNAIAAPATHATALTNVTPLSAAENRCRVDRLAAIVKPLPFPRSITQVEATGLHWQWPELNQSLRQSLMFNTTNLFCNFARNVLDKRIRSSCYSAAKNHFQQLPWELRSGFIFGKNLYISPEYTHLKDCNIYEVQNLTGALYHGARDPQTVLDLAKQHGAFPPGKGLHVADDAPDVSAA